MIDAVQQVGRHFTHFLQVVEHAAVDHLGAADLIESSDISVLRGLSGFDALKGDALLLRPLGERVYLETRIVVHADRQQRATHPHQLVVRPNETRSRKNGVAVHTAASFGVEFTNRSH